jgi:hypothetical protein
MREGMEEGCIEDPDTNERSDTKSCTEILFETCKRTSSRCCINASSTATVLLGIVHDVHDGVYIVVQRR